MRQTNKTIYQYSRKHQFHSVELDISNVKAYHNSDPISLIYFYFKDSGSYLVFLPSDNKLIEYSR